MKELDPTKPVQLRDGRQVRNVCWDFRRIDGSICISGIIACEKYDLSMTWCANGKRYPNSQFDEVDDLINVPERIEGWANVYPDSESACMMSNGESYISLRGWHKSKEEADRHALRNRIACHYISITVGEGLE